MIKKSLFRIGQNWDWLLLVFSMCLYAAVLSYLSIQRHNSFASNFDLANMDQTVWNTLHGRFFSLSGGIETVLRFSVHADLILILLSPLYLLWDNVRILLISQSIALALGAIPIFLLAKKILKNRFYALVMALAYLLNPGVQWANIYDFHGVTFAIPFLLSAFYCAYTKKWKLFGLFVLLALLTKEEISLFVAMMGLIIFFIFKEKKIGLVTFLVGVVWFLLMAFVVIPRFSPSGQYWALGWVGSSDEETSKLILVPLLQRLFRQFFFASDAGEYYVSLLKPFAFLPLLGFPWLVMAFPELAINLLSSQGQMRATNFHYDSGIIPALVIAAIFGISYFMKGINLIKPLKKYAQLINLGIIFSLLLIAVRVNYHYSPLPTTPSCWRIVYQPSSDDQEFEKVLQNLPPQVSVTASGNVRPHITHRENAFILPNAVDTAQYVAILTQERIVGNYRPIDTQFVELLSASNNHELIFQRGQFYLFKRKS